MCKKKEKKSQKEELEINTVKENTTFLRNQLMLLYYAFACDL